MNGYIFVIAFYSIVMIALGFYFSKRRNVKDASGFFVAGRGLSTRLLFTTLLASNIGAGSTIGLAGMAYKYGISAWWWIGASGLGSIFLAYWVGPRIYAKACEHGFFTLGDYLEYRYSKLFRGTTSLMMGIGTLAIFGGQLLGIAWILQTVSGLSKTSGILIGALVVVLYSISGGLTSAAAVNMFQIAVKMLGFVLAAVAAYVAVGGFSGLAVKIAAVAPVDNVMLSWDGIGLTVIIGFFLMLTPSFCISPGLIGKVYGAESVEAVKRGTALNGVMQWLFGMLIVFIGMSAFAMVPTLANRELALPTAIIELMPFWIAALALAAIFAAEVSTSDAILYMIAGAWANDVYKGLINPNISSKNLLILGRVMMAVGGAVAILFAMVLPNIIGALTIFYTLMSVSLAAPLFFGLFTKSADSRGALLSAIIGVVVTIYFQFFATKHGVWLLNAQSTGILFSIAFMAVWTLMRKLRLPRPC
ncbi:sodium:solute symporter family protein [Deferribacterales bacterium RsTz2092]|nr:sodium:solute symporter family protein [Deferribacterales bacterium]